MPAVAASPIPAVLVKLGPLVTDRIADLRPYLDSVPDPAFAARPVVLADRDPAGMRLRGRLGCEEHRRARRVGSAGLNRAADSDRDPRSCAQVVACSVAGHDDRVLGAVDGDALDRAVCASSR